MTKIVHHPLHRQAMLLPIDGGSIGTPVKVFEVTDFALDIKSKLPMIHDVSISVALTYLHGMCVGALS